MVERATCALGGFQITDGKGRITGNTGSHQTWKKCHLGKGTDTKRQSKS